jgi:transposase
MMLNKIKTLKENATLNTRAKKVVDPLFRNHDFFDANDLLQTKYEMLRRVLLDGWHIVEAAKSFGFSRPSFYKALMSYQDKGLAGLLPCKKGPQNPHKFSKEVMLYIRLLITEDPEIKPLVIANKLQNKFGLTVHHRSIERALKQVKKKHQRAHR